MSEEPRRRISWVPNVTDPAAPTAEEIAAAVPLDGYEVVDDGLQFTRDDTAEIPPILPLTIRYYLEPTEPDWIVFRAADDLPSGAMPQALDGVWVNRRPWMMPLSAEEMDRAYEEGRVLAVFVSTGRFEAREDGAVAEVWEMRP